MIGLGIHSFLKIRRAAALLAALALASCGSKEGEGVGPKEAPPATPGAVLVVPVTITTPLSQSVSSKLSQLTVSGTCTIGATVVLKGDALGSYGCQDGDFTFTTTKNTDGNYQFLITQGFSSTRISPSVTVAWVRDATPPAAPRVTAPSTTQYFSSGSTLTISGECETGASVALTGNATGSMTCAASAFSFTVSKNVDGPYTFDLNQTDPVGNVSQTSSVQWTRDSVAPSAPTLDSPTANPYISAEDTVSISGTCETGALVVLSGAESDTVQCSASSYQFQLNQSGSGSFNYSVSQKDRAENTSPPTSFQWQRNLTVPTIPVVTTPSTSPFYSNGNSLTISGSCNDGQTVSMSGSATDSAVCASSSYSFTVNKGSDSSYSFSLLQSSGPLESAATTVVWVRDTVAPSAPVLTTPASSPLISNSNNLALSGTCEPNATVNLSGDASDSVLCSAGGTFSLNVSKSTDGTYAFTLNQTDRAGNSSASINQSWTRDTLAPAAVTVTSHSSPFLSNTNSITLSGACETNATVEISGGTTGTTTCAASTYSFVINKTSDGIYNFTLLQKDRANNSSPTRQFTWQRDATAPSAPTISSPATSPYQSSGNTLTITGSCETGATVNLSGSNTNSMTCASSAYTFTVTQNSDATYNYSLTQTDLAGNTSSSSSLQWVRDSSVPATPVITAPATTPYYSNGSSLTISGSCTTGFSVELSGSDTASTTCASSAFSFSVSKSTDATYTYSVRQKSLTNIYSAAASLSWIRDTVAPLAPTVTSPATTTLATNSSSLTISGSCENSATVRISGDATANTTCVGGTYSMSVAKTVDGVYNLVVRQTDLAGNISGSSAVAWTRDTVAPAAVAITSPTANPFASGDTTITIKGTCEPNSTVTMSGDATGTVTCTSLSTFSLNVTKSTDGTSTMNFSQKDLAGNTSGSTAFQWIRDTSVPPTPIITAPAADPFHSNGNTITITATCAAGLSPSAAVVTLSGDVMASDVTSPAGSLEQTCTSSPVTFTVQKTVDDNYTFYVDQFNPNAGTTSGADSISWIRDTVAPSAPTVTSPATSPFTAPGDLTISGSCEANTTVYLTGGSTQNQVCSVSGTYSFFVLKTTDATYNFSISQMDLAGNTSASATQTWVRDSNAIAPPTIQSPASTPITNNASSLSISGGCTTGYTVKLGGSVVAGDVTSPASSLTQECVGSTYSFEVAKTVDGTYALNLIQSYNSVNSPQATLSWVRDTVAPTLTVSTFPPASNISTTASFAFTSSETGSTFVCSFDGADFSSCASPLNLASLVNGSHTMKIKALDVAGNESTEYSYTWTQAAYSTLALYHLNNSDPTLDSSLFTSTAAFNSNLTANGTPANDTTGKHPTSAPSSRSFGSNNSYSVTSNSALNAGTATMTVEGFVKLSSTLAANGDYYTLISKSNASPALGWELRMRRVNASKSVLDFVGSLNGTTSSTVTSNSFNVTANTWYYFAITWKNGVVTFYFDANGAVAKGSKTIGTAGTATLFATSAPLRLGANATSGTGTSKWLNGSLDEVRISQRVRTITFPSTEFTPD